MLNRFSVWISSCVAISWVDVCAAAPGVGQSFYGSLVSVVKDAQGGVIPGATVVLVNTGHERTARRRERRRRHLPVPESRARHLPARGRADRVSALRAGRHRSQRAVRPPHRSPRCKLGSLSETVLVSGEAPVLQTENASVGIVVESSRIRQLSLNGGNVLNLITLAPSVVPQGGSEGSLTGKNVFAAGNFQIGGGTANQSASYFDGVTVQDSAYGNIVVLTPSPESVAEFTRADQQQQRRVRAVHRRRHQHGLAVGHQHLPRQRSSNTTATRRSTRTRSSASGPGSIKPPFVQNNFGGSMGGPVLQEQAVLLRQLRRLPEPRRRAVPPHRADGRDEGRGLLRLSRHVVTTVVPIYDPWTQCGINNPGTGVFNGVCGAPGVPNRQQFPGNIIPSNRISPIAKKLLDFPDLRRTRPWPAAGPRTTSSGTPRSAATTIRSTFAPTTT